MPHTKKKCHRSSWKDGKPEVPAKTVTFISWSEIYPLADELKTPTFKLSFMPVDALALIPGISQIGATLLFIYLFIYLFHLDCHRLPWGWNILH